MPNQYSLYPTMEGAGPDGAGGISRGSSRWVPSVGARVISRGPSGWVPPEVKERRLLRHRILESKLAFNPGRPEPGLVPEYPELFFAGEKAGEAAGRFAWGLGKAGYKKYLAQNVEKYVMPAINRFQTTRPPWKKFLRSISPGWRRDHNIQMTAVKDRAARLLDRKDDWVDQRPELEGLLRNAAKNHDTYYTPRELGGKKDDIIGGFLERTDDIKALPYRTTSATRKADYNTKRMVGMHETGHYYTPGRTEGLDWKLPFDRAKVRESVMKSNASLPQARREAIANSVDNYFFGNHGGELRERAAQLYDFIGRKKGIHPSRSFIVTRADLDDAIDNYLSSGMYDNNMREFLDGIVDREDLQYAMNRYPLAIIPPLAISNDRMGAYKEKR